MNKKQEKLKDGYSVCYNIWAFDSSIKNELGLLLIISSLSAKYGYAIASNEYLVAVFGRNESTISRKIKKLEKLGYIEIDYKRRGAEIVERKLRLTNLKGKSQKSQSSNVKKVNRTNDEKVKDNNTSNKITKDNNKILFDIVWDLYDKKVGTIEKLEKKWNKLSIVSQNEVMCYIPKYKESQPNKQFRKNFETFLNNKSWNDEIIVSSNNNKKQPVQFESLSREDTGEITF